MHYLPWMLLSTVRSPGVHMACLQTFKERMFFGVAVAKHKEPTFINILRPQLNYAWKSRKVLICNSVPWGSWKQRCCLQILAKFFNTRCSQDLHCMSTIIKLIIYTLRMFLIMSWTCQQRSTIFSWKFFRVALKSKQIFAVPENWARGNAYALKNVHVLPVNVLDTTCSTPRF